MKWTRHWIGARSLYINHSTETLWDQHNQISRFVILASRCRGFNLKTKNSPCHTWQHLTDLEHLKMVIFVKSTLELAVHKMIPGWHEFRKLPSLYKLADVCGCAKNRDWFTECSVLSQHMGIHEICWTYHLWLICKKQFPHLRTTNPQSTRFSCTRTHPNHHLQLRPRVTLHLFTAFLREPEILLHTFAPQSLKAPMYVRDLQIMDMCNV